MLQQGSTIQLNKKNTNTNIHRSLCDMADRHIATVPLAAHRKIMVFKEEQNMMVCHRKMMVFEEKMMFSKQENGGF